ncbi:MAG TPA: terminase large subunit, partial [Clostridia bacterium]|nr:terminase large subunit [Clostridia bacterium]
MKVHELNRHVLAWIEIIEKDKIGNCEDQQLLAAYVRRCFAEENIYTDNEILEKYLRQEKYFPFSLIPWEKFCIALHLCTFWEDSGLPRWPDLFLLLGRGAGKDAFIAYESYCVLSPHSGLVEYDVDICANVEEQALRPVRDVVAALNNPQNRVNLSKYFRWTAEVVTGIKYNGVMKGRTKAPSSKDGMRSGMVVYNEVHQYENYDNIKVFATSLGKKKHPRRLYATSQGDVRDGPLDDMLDRSEQILKHGAPDNGFLPFICRLNQKELVHDPKYWPQANPTLPYAPTLLAVMKKEYVEWLENPGANADFMTKRMGRPQSDTAVPVTKYDNIKATAVIILPNGDKKPREMPDLRGRSCTGGIDYVLLTDFASVNLRFWIDGEKCDINHSWLCLQSRDLHRIKADWRAWAERGLLTLVDDVEVPPELLANWFYEKAQDYNIVKIAADNFRYALLASAFKEIGFDA